MANATELGVAYLTILPSMQGFNRRVGSQAASAAREGGKRFSGVFSAFMGGAITAATGIITARVVRGVKESIQSASSLVEVQNKVNVVFGRDGAKALDKWSKSAANAFGQSTSGALQAASNFAIFGKSAGLSGDKLVGFSTRFTELASDLASFHDTSPEEAILAIGAAFRGEMEPIRRYGVLLDDASLRQEAVRQGLIKTTKQALTPQQKVLAAQALILKQTSDAQGDYARTADSYANAQRRFNAQVENGKAALGKIFLPAASSVLKYLNDKFVPLIVDKVIPAISDFFSSMKKDKELKTALRDLKEALKPFMGIDLKKNLDDVAAALPGVVRGLADVVTKYREIATAIDKFENSSFGEGDKVGGPVGQFVKDFGAGGTIEVALVHFRWAVKRHVKAGWADAKQSFIENHTAILNDVKGFVGGVARWFKNLGPRAYGAWSGMWRGIESFGKKTSGGIAATVAGWRTRVVARFKELSSSARSTTSGMLASIKERWATRTSEIRSTVTGWKNRLVDTGKRLSTDLRTVISDMLTKIKDRFNRGVDAIGAAWDRLKAKAASPVRFVIQTVLNGGLIRAFNTIAKALPGVGSLPAVHVPKGFAKGTASILPGWSPGRDIHDFWSPTGGRLRLSGGEAILRPELARKLGKRRIDAANRDAMHGRLSKGIERVQSFAQGGFFGGTQPVPGSFHRHSGYSWARVAGDIPVGMGTPVHAWKSGVIATVKYLSTSYGRHIIENVAGSRVYYAHLRSASVRAGQHVNQGQTIGYSDSTGNSTGPHLHFEIRGGNAPISGGITGGILSVIDYVKKFKDKIKGSMDKLKGLGSTPWAQMLQSAGTKLKDAMVKKIQDGMSSLRSSVGAGFTALTGGSNRAIGRKMMLQRWPASQWPALNSLWTKESGWRTTARNPSSGAYGIPQALPASKMASAGSDWRTNPATQIKWGLGYIASRYGSPGAAWAHSKRTNWYGNGGVIREPIVGVGLRTGESYGFGEKGKEAVVPLAGNMAVPSSGGRPLQIRLDLGEDLRYYVQGILDDNDEFKAGIGRLSR